MYMYYFKGKRLIYEVSLYPELKYVLWGGALLLRQYYFRQYHFAGYAKLKSQSGICLFNDPIFCVLRASNQLRY